MKEYYVYCYFDIRKKGEFIYDKYKFNYEPIYIGKGKNNRYLKHFNLYKNSNTRFHNKINSCIKNGFKPIVKKIKTNLTENESFLLEIKLIKLIGRIENGGSLTNLTDGGDGISGYKMSDETKLKKSIAMTGKKLGPMTEETKKKISNSKKGKSIPKLKNRIISEETKKKMSEKGKLRIGDKNPMYNKKHKKETKEKISKKVKKRFGTDNPNYKRIYKESEKTYDTWELINIKNEKLIIDNLNKFCKENNLNPSCMRDIYYGRQKKHKDWIFVKKLTNNVKRKKDE